MLKASGPRGPVISNPQYLRDRSFQAVEPAKMEVSEKVTQLNIDRARKHRSCAGMPRHPQICLSGVCFHVLNGAVTRLSSSPVFRARCYAVPERTQTTVGDEATSPSLQPDSSPHPLQPSRHLIRTTETFKRPLGRLHRPNTIQQNPFASPRLCVSHPQDGTQRRQGAKTQGLGAFFDRPNTRTHEKEIDNSKSIPAAAILPGRQLDHHAGRFLRK